MRYSRRIIARDFELGWLSRVVVDSDQLFHVLQSVFGEKIEKIPDSIWAANISLENFITGKATGQRLPYFLLLSSFQHIKTSN